MRALIIGLMLLWLVLSAAWAQTGTASRIDVSPPVCTPPPCPEWGRLACGGEDGCPGGCGTVCRLPVFLPVMQR